MCENQSVKGFLVITPCNICWLANVVHLIIKKSLNWWSTKGKLSFSYRQNRTRINLNILMIKVSDFSGMNIFSTSFAIFFSFPRIIVSKATPELSGLTLNGVGSGSPLDSGLKPWKHLAEVLISFSVQFSSVQSLSRVRLFATPWTAAQQASLSITSSRSSPKPMSIKTVMLSNHLILCRPLLLLPSIFPSIRVFSNESALCMRWPKYWSFSFSISPSNEYPGLISFRMDWLDLLAVQGTLKSLL